MVAKENVSVKLRHIYNTRKYTHYFIYLQYLKVFLLYLFHSFIHHSPVASVPSVVYFYWLKSIGHRC